MNEFTIFHDPACAGYRAPHHPERPERVTRTADHLKRTLPGLAWRTTEVAAKRDAMLAHTERHWERLTVPEDFDGDTAWHEGIREIALSATGQALGAMRTALGGSPAFALMRPPGHHATADQAMGFCYLNHVAIAARAALVEGCERVAIWDFDVHHGNGTEAIVLGDEGIRFASVHQHPAYPGTGSSSQRNVRNDPLPPGTRAELHMQALRESWEWLMEWKPGLLLVSAGFDAYARDPLAQMRLEGENYATLGGWLHEANEADVPVAAVLEGGYSEELPQLVEAFVRGWGKGSAGFQPAPGGILPPGQDSISP